MAAKKPFEFYYWPRSEKHTVRICRNTGISSISRRGVLHKNQRCKDKNLQTPRHKMVLIPVFRQVRTLRRVFAVSRKVILEALQQNF